MVGTTTSLNRLAAITICIGVLVPAAVGGQTKATDKVPPFDLAYFVGTWAFDWTSPETPLGPAGDMVGTETFQLMPSADASKPVNGFPGFPDEVVRKITAHVGTVLESRIEGAGPAGAIRSRTVLIYDRNTNEATQYAVDSTGSVTVRHGTLTGDLGGIYTFTWQSKMPRDGREIHVKGRRVAFSPLNFRDFVQYSLDNKRFVTYGQPWYRKQNGF